MILNEHNNRKAQDRTLSRDFNADLDVIQRLHPSSSSIVQFIDIVMNL